VILAAIEDIFFSLAIRNTHHESLLEDLLSWRNFLEGFRNVKVLRLHHGLEAQVADMLRQPTVNPPPREEVDPDATTFSSTSIDGNRSQFPLDILPSVEEIVVYARRPDTWIDEKERASVLESVGPFVTVQREVGCP
jgi:hypothetical protein